MINVFLVILLVLFLALVYWGISTPLRRKAKRLEKEKAEYLQALNRKESQINWVLQFLTGAAEVDSVVLTDTLVNDKRPFDVLLKEHVESGEAASTNDSFGQDKLRSRKHTMNASWRRRISGIADARDGVTPYVRRTRR